MLKKCIPNRTDIHSEIDNNIDLEFIKHYLVNEIIDNSFFSKLIYYIIEKIKLFQSKSDDDNLEIFISNITKDIQKKLEYKDILPNLFREIFKRLEKIIYTRDIFLSNSN